jgi:ABC-type antimicrobial peptide transport system permease subunit
MILMGLYGIISFSAAARRREIGVRIAIGAQHRDVLRALVSESAAFVLAGLCGGLLISVMATRYIGPLLFGVTSFDPVSISTASILVLATSIVAALLPAWKMCRTDPFEALRHE